MAILAGLGISSIVAIVLAVIGIWLEAEYTLPLALGVVFIGLVIRNLYQRNLSLGQLLAPFFVLLHIYYTK